MFKSLAFAALLSLGATSAFADTLVTASLTQPVSKPTKVIASDLLWSCDGSSCQTQVSDELLGSPSLCRDLTKQVGAVNAYGAFTADKLAKCNAGRASQTTASR